MILLKKDQVKTMSSEGRLSGLHTVMYQKS
jgi:hypothetical protein